jgi:hypothetical protein
MSDGGPHLVLAAGIVVQQQAEAIADLQRQLAIFAADLEGLKSQTSPVSEMHMQLGSCMSDVEAVKESVAVLVALKSDMQAAQANLDRLMVSGSALKDAAHLMHTAAG